MGYSPWGRKESDMTEQLHFFFFRYLKRLSRNSLWWAGNEGEEENNAFLALFPHQENWDWKQDVRTSERNSLVSTFCARACPARRRVTGPRSLVRGQVGETTPGWKHPEAQEGADFSLQEAQPALDSETQGSRELEDPGYGLIGELRLPRSLPPDSPADAASCNRSPSNSSLLRLPFQFNN